MRFRFLAPLAALALSACATLPAPSASRGMVSAADPRAAAAGVEMLRAGGSATDAALATMVALTVVEPQSSGIGGGGFYVAGDPAGTVETIDGRETAPAAASGDWFYADGKPLTVAQAIPGGRSVGVPGNIALMAKAHAKRGKVPWARLFAPAVRLAEGGFTVTPRLYAALARNRETGALDPAARALFYGADGNPVPVGTTVRNPALAGFLNRLANEGAPAFYTRRNADAIVGAVTTAARNPAPMTTADVGSYTAKDRAPVCGTYRAHRICGMGPPSSGATTVFAILKQLEGFNLTALGKDSPVAWHLIAESMRLAYADRDRWLADPDFVTVPVTGLIDPNYLAERGSRISPSKTMAAAEPGEPEGAPMAMADGLTLDVPSTSHFVAVDRSGAAVSYTSTIESAFGSGLMVNGYYLNNELTDFSLVPEAGGRPVANRVEGGKRPRSSMAPTLVYAPDGTLRLAVGAAGGATIIAQVAKAIIGVIDWGLSAQDAIALPVLFAPGGTTVWVEKGSAHEAMIPALIALGHADVRTREASFKANAIERVGGRWVGAADPRSEGIALGE